VLAIGLSFSQGCSDAFTIRATTDSTAPCIDIHKVYGWKRAIPLEDGHFSPERAMVEQSKMKITNTSIYVIFGFLGAISLLVPGRVMAQAAPGPLPRGQSKSQGQTAEPQATPAAKLQVDGKIWVNVADGTDESGGKGFEWRKALAAIIREEVVLAATLAEDIPAGAIRAVAIQAAVIPGALGEVLRAEVPTAGRDMTGRTSKIIRESGRSFIRRSR